MLDCFSESCREIDVNADTIDDALMVMNSVRSDITTGFALRRELAQKRDKQDGEDQLFSRLGGLEGIDEFVTRLYECVERDRRINPFFTGAKLKAIKQAQTDFIIKTLGGPSEYSGRSLEEIHAVLAITDYHLDCFLQLVARALRDCGQDQETVDEVSSIVVFRFIASIMMVGLGQVVVKLGNLRTNILKGHYAKMGYTIK
ncbi:Myoglobin, putative [Perkinsus marinus ATCC 50983]|nr:Myoglobin, putative [Perkinsus marinus ATCC 50983]EER04235.1 Myoglobin, putative [Perkinsus marinus ATCC 50983]|eukprot:XP_002772419.1 Myoglobin, putative [Perkinsus marinus ATCC 50983]